MTTTRSSSRATVLAWQRTRAWIDVVYTAMATDADGDTLSYSLSGTDAARFTIDPNTGAVRFIASPDFENPGDVGGDNVYDITVTASDGDNSTNHDVTITVTNENDNDPIFSVARRWRRTQMATACPENHPGTRGFEDVVYTAGGDGSR